MESLWAYCPDQDNNYYQGKSFRFVYYLLDQDNIPKENLLSEDQISYTSKFEWPNSYWFIAERTNGRLAMIGFMAVIINYSLFGWIAYPIL